MKDDSYKSVLKPPNKKVPQAMAVSNSDMAKMIRNLAKEVQVDFVKDDIKRLVSQKQQQLIKISKIEHQLFDAENELAYTEELLVRLGSGDLSVLELQQSHDCKFCRNTTYNQLVMKQCPNCGR